MAKKSKTKFVPKVYTPWIHKKNTNYNEYDMKKGFHYLLSPKNRNLFKKYCERNAQKTKLSERNIKMFFDLLGVSSKQVSRFAQLSLVDEDKESYQDALQKDRSDLKEICWKYEVSRGRAYQVFTRYMVCLKDFIYNNPDKETEILMGEPITKHIEHMGKIIYENELPNLREHFESFAKVYVHMKEFCYAMRQSKYVGDLIEVAHPGAINLFQTGFDQISIKYRVFKKYVMEVEAKFRELKSPVAVNNEA